MRLRAIIVVAVLCGAFAVTAFAGGFQTGTQNARAMGMGHAFVGMASDASAIYFNPAGLANLKGMHVMAGTTLIMPTLKFTGPKPLTTATDAVEKTFTPINLYAVYGMDNGLSFGVGVFNPYGLGSEWPKTWVGKRLAVETELRTFFITPTIAYKLSDQLSVGAVFNYVISSVTFKQVADFPAIPLAPGVALPAAPNVGINLEGDGDAAYSFALGVLYKATDQLSIGVSYRHETPIDFNGDLTFSGLPAKPTGFPVGHSDLFPNGTGKTKITMPYDLRAGVAYDVSKDLTVAADFQYVGWESYKELAVDFAKNTTAWTDLKTVKDWKNAFAVRFGGEYRMDALALRAGYVFDATPIPTKTMDPSLPGADRHEFTVGLGYQLTKNIRVDAAYQYISFNQEVNDSGFGFNGKYENSTNLFGFNFGFGF